MKSRRVAVRLISRLCHAALVLTLTILLFRAVYYGFSLLVTESRQLPALEAEMAPQQGMDKPSPEEIVSKLQIRREVRQC